MRAIFLITTASAFAFLSLAMYSDWLLPNHDNLWLLIAARRLLDGGHYYHDVFEVNPPLILMLLVPGIWMSSLFSMDPYQGHILWVSILVAGSTIAIRPALAWLTETRGIAADAIALGYAAVLLIIPGLDFGQREHILVILITPALLQFAAQTNGLQVKALHSNLVFAAASVGILIKPHFMILVLAYFGARIARERTWRAALNAHCLIFCLLALGYGLAILFLFPGWIEIAKIGNDLYGAYQERLPVVLWSSRVDATTLLVAWLLGERLPIPDRTRILVRHLAAAALLLFVVVAAQHKGWAYHLLPISLYNTMILTVLALQMIRNWSAGKFGKLPAMLTIVLIFYALLVQFIYLKWRMPEWARTRTTYEALIEPIRDVAKGQPVLALDTSVVQPLPILVRAKAQWASRFPCQWLIPGILQMEDGTPEERARAAKYRKLAIGMTVEDLDRYRPLFIMVRNGNRLLAVRKKFDFIQYFSTDKRFQAAWSKYEAFKQVDDWTYYKRKPNS